MVRQVYFLVLVFILNTQIAWGDTVEILVGVEKHEAEYLHDRYLKLHGIPREMYQDEGGFLISLGKASNVSHDDIPRLKEVLTEAIKQELLALDGAVKFYFGPVRLVGNPYFPKVMALARNKEDFEALNGRVAYVFDRFSHGKYSLDEDSEPENYLPAMELNATAGVEVFDMEVEELLEVLSYELKRVDLHMTHVVFRHWDEPKS